MGSKLIYLDESSFNISNCKSLGWGPKGTKIKIVKKIKK